MYMYISTLKINYINNNIFVSLTLSMFIYQPVSWFGTTNTCIIYQTSRLFMLKYIKCYYY